MQQALNTRQDGGNVVRRAPSVLEDVQAELAVRVDVRVEHAAEELDRWGLVRVRFVKGQDEAKGAVLERGVGCGVEGKG